MPRLKQVWSINNKIIKELNIVETQLKLHNQILLRKLKRFKIFPFYMIFITLLLVLFSLNSGISIEPICILSVYLVVSSVYESWIKIAEVETEIVYLHAGIMLIRNK